MTISPDLLHTVVDAAADEKDLALAFKRGEKGAYQTIHDAYAPRVYGVCRRMLASREDAEEAAQETFLRVYQALGRFNGRYQLGAWITRIATNVCLDHLRSHARKPQFAEATVELMDLQTNLDYDDSEPESLMIRDSESRQVRRVLASLPPMHRAAIVLREYEDLSYEEIASALGITDCQVKALIHRARQNFKKSWVRQLAQALVPSGLVARLRRVSTWGQTSNSNSPAQFAEVVTPSMNTVASCAAFAHHCGQALAERLAPVAMAALVGGTATAGAGVVAMDDHRDGQHRVVAVDDAPVEVAENDLRPRSDPAAVTEPGDAQEVPDEPEPNQLAPEEAPPSSPPPSEPSEGGTTPGGAPAQPGSGSSQPPADPGKTDVADPLTAFLGTSRATPSYAAPVSHSTQMNCAARHLDQRLEGNFWNGSESHPATFAMTAGPDRAFFELTVEKNGHGYTYSSWGAAPNVAWDVAQETLTISGSYGPRYGHEPTTVGLPAAGDFQLMVSLDCELNRLRSENLSLSS